MVEIKVEDECCQINHIPHPPIANDKVCRNVSPYCQTEDISVKDEMQSESILYHQEDDSMSHVIDSNSSFADVKDDMQFECTHSLGYHQRDESMYHVIGTTSCLAGIIAANDENEVCVAEENLYEEGCDNKLNLRENHSYYNELVSDDIKTDTGNVVSPDRIKDAKQILVKMEDTEISDEYTTTNTYWKVTSENLIEDEHASHKTDGAPQQTNIEKVSDNIATPEIVSSVHENHIPDKINQARDDSVGNSNSIQKDELQSNKETYTISSVSHDDGFSNKCQSKQFRHDKYKVDNVKRRRSSYTTAFKLTVISKALEWENNRKAANHFGVNEKQIRHWIKSRDQLKDSECNSKHLNGAGRRVTYPELERPLLAWWNDQKKKKNAVPFCQLQNEAKRLIPDINFKASYRWLRSFRKRHSLTKVKAKGKTKPSLLHKECLHGEDLAGDIEQNLEEKHSHSNKLISENTNKHPESTITNYIVEEEKEEPTKREDTVIPNEPIDMDTTENLNEDKQYTSSKVTDVPEQIQTGIVSDNTCIAAPENVSSNRKDQFPDKRALDRNGFVGNSNDIQKVELHSNKETNTSSDDKHHLFSKYQRTKTTNDQRERSERPHMCNVCGKGFKYSSNLKKHVTVHTTDKQYICKVCGKMFKYSSSLTSHMSLHRNGIQCLCEVCGKGFKQRAALTVHMHIHKMERKLLVRNAVKGLSLVHILKNIWKNNVLVINRHSKWKL